MYKIEKQWVCMTIKRNSKYLSCSQIIYMLQKICFVYDEITSLIMKGYHCFFLSKPIRSTKISFKCKWCICLDWMFGYRLIVFIIGRKICIISYEWLRNTSGIGMFNLFSLCFIEVWITRNEEIEDDDEDAWIR